MARQPRCGARPMPDSTCPGVFRDQADFAVLVLFEKDDPFGHPRFSYLPDGNFAGIELEFDISFHGVHPFESKKWPWTDWQTSMRTTARATSCRRSLIEIATGPSGRTGASWQVRPQRRIPPDGDRVVALVSESGVRLLGPAYHRGMRAGDLLEHGRPEFLRAGYLVATGFAVV